MQGGSLSYSLLSPFLAPAFAAGLTTFSPAALTSAVAAAMGAVGWVWLLAWRGRRGDDWVEDVGGGVVEEDLVEVVVVVVEGTRNSGGGFCEARDRSRELGDLGRRRQSRIKSMRRTRGVAWMEVKSRACLQLDKQERDEGRVSSIRRRPRRSQTRRSERLTSPRTPREGACPPPRRVQTQGWGR